MNTVESNKLIAEFIGYVALEDPEYGRFHSSWEWLMPVVETIEKLGVHVTIKQSFVTLKGFYSVGNPNVSTHYEWYSGSVDESKFQSIYVAVTEFAKKYNHDKSIYERIEALPPKP